MSKSKRQSTIYKRVSQAILALAAITLIVLGFKFHGTIGQAYSLATTHQPEPYSELYFTNPSKLPLYSPAGKLEVLNFVITNHEGSRHNYSYSIEETRQGHSQTYQSTVFSLADGASLTRSVSYILPRSYQSIKITISLDGSSQQINFMSKSS
jgi:hypothetical protein